jgi:hypothetical protein
MNEFRYIVGATREVQQNLILWQRKIRDYLDNYYQGNEENARQTLFYGCISKTRILSNNLLERASDFRCVMDSQGLLACASIVQETDIYTDIGEVFPGLEIEALSNSPWNTLDYTQPEKRKGAATSLVEELVKESQSQGFGGILKAITVPSVREFYEKIGFIEDNGTGWMTLTSDAAQEFLIKQEEFRREFRETGN